MSEIKHIKICTKCDQAKPVAEFSMCKPSRDGRRSFCKMCEKEYNIAHRAKPESLAKARATDVKRRSTPVGRAKHRAMSRKRYAGNRERIKAQVAAYVKTPNGRAKSKAAHARRAAKPENRIKHKIACKKYLAKPGNLEKARVASVKSRATPIGRAKRRNSSRKRRALKAGAAIGDLQDIANWEATWRTKKPVECHWCCKKFTGNKCHADHRVPLSKGGSHALENLVISCKTCNLKKHAKMPEVFNAELEQPLLFY